MRGLADLLGGAQLARDDSALPTLMVGEIVDTDPLRVKVPAIDGGQLAVAVFGNWPDATAGDEVRVMRDEFGGLTVVAWESA